MAESKMTILDVARLAGVGKSTVSRYLNGGYVSAENCAKIEAVIREHHYEPSLAAKMLKAKNTRIIGILAPTLDSTTSSRMMMKLSQELAQKNYDTLIIYTNRGDTEIHAIEQMVSLNVDGIVVLATNITTAHEKIVRELKIPIIFVGQKIDNGNYIVYDDFAAGQNIAEFVTSHGPFGKYLYVGVDAYDEAVGIRRKFGVYSALEAKGIVDVDFLLTDFTFEQAVEQIHVYLQDHRPDCIICATDRIALACYKEVQRLGLRIPEDVSICGFGGYRISSLLTPALTTVRYPNEYAGELAAEMITALIEGSTSVETQITLDYQLVEGESIRRSSGK